MNSKIEEKLQKFLKEKIENIYNITKEDKLGLDISYITAQMGFVHSLLKDGKKKQWHKFSNSNACSATFVSMERGSE